jgi:hypothetical protein
MPSMFDADRDQTPPQTASLDTTPTKPKQLVRREGLQ